MDRVGNREFDCVFRIYPVVGCGCGYDNCSAAITARHGGRNRSVGLSSNQ